MGVGGIFVLRSSLALGNLSRFIQKTGHTHVPWLEGLRHPCTAEIAQLLVYSTRVWRLRSLAAPLLRSPHVHALLCVVVILRFSGKGDLIRLCNKFKTVPAMLTLSLSKWSVGLPIQIREHLGVPTAFEPFLLRCEAHGLLVSPSCPRLPSCICITLLARVLPMVDVSS